MRIWRFYIFLENNKLELWEKTNSHCVTFISFFPRVFASFDSVMNEVKSLLIPWLHMFWPRGEKKEEQMAKNRALGHTIFHRNIPGFALLIFQNFAFIIGRNIVVMGYAPWPLGYHGNPSWNCFHWLNNCTGRWVHMCLCILYWLSLILLSYLFLS